AANGGFARLFSDTSDPSTLGSTGPYPASNIVGTFLSVAFERTFSAPIALSFNGFTFDRVRQSNASQAPDGRPDAMFTVSFPNSGSTRTVTSLRLDGANGGIWDTDSATMFWTLGAAPSLGGALYNQQNDGVNFPVASAGSFVIFASEWSLGAPFPNGLFSPGNQFTLTIGFSDGTAEQASTTITEGPPVVTIATATPTVLEGGATASFLVSRTGSTAQTLMVNYTAGGTAVAGTHYIPLTGLVFIPQGLSTAAIPVAPLENNLVDGDKSLIVSLTPDALYTLGSPSTATMTVQDNDAATRLIFSGLLADRVGQNNLFQSADGHPDPTFTVMLPSVGSTRTITSLRLDGTGGGTWDTNGNNGFWTLAAAYDPSGPLLNSGANDSVDFPVTPGTSFVIFASEWFLGAPFSSGLFHEGNSFTLTIGFSDGTQTNVSTTIPVAPDSVLVKYEGKLRDRVGQNNQFQGTDGNLDPTFTVILPAGVSGKVTSLRLDSSKGGIWDTNAGTGFWTLAAASTPDAALYNDASDRVSFAIPVGRTFSIFASDWFLGQPFPSGLFGSNEQFKLTVGFDDGSTARGSVTLP
ncbi:MAG TPA: Calx-beta domain-containing protein, partial [Candidatus Binatia bacterium]